MKGSWVTGWSVFPCIDHTRNQDVVVNARDSHGAVNVVCRSRCFGWSDVERTLRQVRMADAVRTAPRKVFTRDCSCVRSLRLVRHCNVPRRGWRLSRLVTGRFDHAGVATKRSGQHISTRTRQERKYQACYKRKRTLHNRW